MRNRRKRAARRSILFGFLLTLCASNALAQEKNHVRFVNYTPHDVWVAVATIKNDSLDAHVDTDQKLAVEAWFKVAAHGTVDVAVPNWAKLTSEYGMFYYAKVQKGTRTFALSPDVSKQFGVRSLPVNLASKTSLELAIGTGTGLTNGQRMTNEMRAFEEKMNREGYTMVNFQSIVVFGQRSNKSFTVTLGKNPVVARSVSEFLAKD